MVRPTPSSNEPHTFYLFQSFKEYPFKICKILKRCGVQKILIFHLPIIFLFSGCEKPTYPKEKVEESIIQLCKKEYNLDVKTRILGKTLAVGIPIEGLVDENMRLAEEAGDKIEDVALSIHRVTMSTDRDLEFYILTALDKKLIGAQFMLIGYLYDVKRVRLLDISRGEYHRRILRDFKFDPKILGENRVLELFSRLNSNDEETKALMGLFYPVYSISVEGSQRFEIIDLESKQISAQEALIFVNTKEYFNIKPGLEGYLAFFPSGFENEYLFLINISTYPNIIKEVISKYFQTPQEIKQRFLKETFDSYKDISLLDSEGLPIRDLSIGEFLTEQMVRRIKSDFEEDRILKKIFQAPTAEGIIDKRTFRFRVGAIPIAKLDIKKIEKIIFEKTFKTAAEVLRGYWFEDFDGIEVTLLLPEQRTKFLDKETLEKFRKKKIKIEEIL